MELVMWIENVALNFKKGKIIINERVDNNGLPIVGYVAIQVTFKWKRQQNLRSAWIDMRSSDSPR